MRKPFLLAPRILRTGVQRPGRLQLYGVSQPATRHGYYLPALQATTLPRKAQTTKLPLSARHPPRILRTGVQRHSRKAQAGVEASHTTRLLSIDTASYNTFTVSPAPTWHPARWCAAPRPAAACGGSRPAARRSCPEAVGLAPWRPPPPGGGRRRRWRCAAEPPGWTGWQTAGPQPGAEIVRIYNLKLGFGFGLGSWTATLAGNGWNRYFGILHPNNIKQLNSSLQHTETNEDHKVLAGDLRIEDFAMDIM